MGPLPNTKHEQFCQLLAAGHSKTKAYELAYNRPAKNKRTRKHGSRLWGQLKASPKIRQRTFELMAQHRKAADLSYDDLLDETLLNIDLAREAGQHAAAFKGIQMLGGEKFSAFVERRETVNVDIQVRSKAELKQLLIDDYGEQLAEAIWQNWSKPKLIEQHSDANNSAVALDQEAEQPRPEKLAKLAMESITNTKAPKV